NAPPVGGPGSAVMSGSGGTGARRDGCWNAVRPTDHGSSELARLLVAAPWPWRPVLLPSWYPTPRPPTPRHTFYSDRRRYERCRGARRPRSSARRGECPAEWWGLRVDLRCLRAAVDRGGGVSIAGRVELGHGALGAVAELEPLIGIV